MIATLLVALLGKHGFNMTLEGAFTLSHACTFSAQGAETSCRVQYSLRPSGGRSTELEFEPDILRSLAPDSRLVGSTLAVDGFYLDENHTRFRVDRVGIKASPAKPAVTSQTVAKPYVTILVRFADFTSITPQPSSWYVDLFNGAYPRLGHYFKDQSAGAISIDGSQVTEWVNLPHPRSYYALPGFPYIDGEKVFVDATASVDATVDFRQFQGINIFMNTDMGSGPAGYASYQHGTMDGQDRYWPTTLNSVTGGGLLALMAHEMGHTFGFDHSSGPYPDKPYDSRWDVMSGGDGPMQLDPKYGNIPVGYNLYHRQTVGWVPPSRVFYAMPGTNQTIRIERLNDGTANGYLGAIVFRGSGSQYFTIESRQRSSYDLSIPGDAVIIHDCDRNRLSYDSRYSTSVADRRSQVIDPDNDGDPNDWNDVEPIANSQWKVGETYTDTTTGIKVSVLSAGATYYNVNIYVPATLNSPNQVVNTTDSGRGSLRGALDFASYFPDLPESKSIQFRIPTSDPNYAGGVFKISPITGFTEIAGSGITIDGSTQTAFTGNTNASGPEVDIDGTNAGTYANAFRIVGSNNLVRGFCLGGFNGANVWILGRDGGGANTVAGCYVGTNAIGSAARTNGQAGIAITDGSSNNVIGGTTTPDRNLVSGNSAGVLIANGGCHNNRIIGNWMGLSGSGLTAVPNSYQGVYIADGCHHNEVGGIYPGERNVLSGNTGSGVDIAGLGSNYNLIRGNYVGTNPAGTGAIPNQGNGITVTQGGQYNEVGGTSAAARNVVSGNGYAGILLYQSGTSHNLVAGNYVGLNASGTSAVGNASGIDIGSSASDNAVGGNAAAYRNVISGNRYNGTQLFEGAFNNKIQGNYYGSNAALTAAVPNVYSGVTLSNGAKSNLIGGSNAGEGNVVVGNQSSGLLLADELTSLNTVQGNWIGVTPAGVAMRNLYQGVALWNGPSNNKILSNTIAFNSDGIGVGVESGKVAPIGNTFRQNRIYSQEYMGINLYNNDGVTPNDSLDADTGPNGLQNFPVISSATRTSSGLAISGTLNSRPNRTYDIDFYSSDAADSSGYGEGQRYVGSVSVSTNASGNASFSVNTAAGSGAWLSATATDSTSGDTSEFGQTLVLANGVVGLTLTPATVNGGSTSVGSVALGSAAPAGGAVVVLSSNNTKVVIPASITIPAGQTSGTFDANTYAVPTNTAVTVTATYNGVSKSAVLTVNATVFLKAFSLSSTTVNGGISTVGILNLTGVAAAGGLTVTITEGSAYVSGPSSVFIAAGSSATSFAIPTVNPPSTQSVVITATLGAISKSQTLTVLRAPKITTLTVAPASVIGSHASVGTVSLDMAAPAGGVTVILSDNSAAVTTPSNVIFAAGATTKSFSILTSGVTVVQTATISAALSGTSKTATLQLLPAVYLASLTITPASIKGGLSAVGQVTLNAAAPIGGSTIGLTHTIASVGMPSTVLVSAGTLSGQFSISTPKVLTTYTCTVTATHVGITKTATLTITP